MTDPELKKLSEMMDDKMRDYIVVMRANEPGEKSRLISELKRNHEELKQIVIKYIEDTKPMIDAFKKTETHKMVHKEDGVYIIKRSQWVIIVGGAVGVVYGTFKILVAFATMK